MNKPFDREVMNLRERPLSSDLNQFESYRDQAMREIVVQMFSPRVSLTNDRAAPMASVGSAVFVGSGLKVRAPAVPAMTVTVDPGLAWFNDGTTSVNIGGVSNVNDLSIIKPLSVTALQTIPVPASDPGFDRIDIVEVKIDRRLMDPTSRDILDPLTGKFTPDLVDKTLSYNLDGELTVNGVGGINYKTGTPAAGPVAPSTDPGYVKISEVFVAAASVVVPQNQIKDLRILALPYGQAPIRLRGIITYDGASNATPSIANFSAPPGVLIGSLFFANGQIRIIVIAGDTAPLVPSSILMSQDSRDAFPGTLDVISMGSLGSTSLPGNFIGAAYQAALLAATPPLVVAQGQPYLEFILDTWDVVTGAPPISMTIPFNASVLLSHGA